MMRLLKPLLEQLLSGPIKTTPKGNLPLRLTMDLISELPMEEWQTLYPIGWHRVVHPRSEEDCLPLHTCRLLAEVADITQRKSGRLTLTTAGEELVRSESWGRIWDRLARAAFKQFNWGWLTNTDEVRGLQTTAPFMLWLLHLHGKDWEDALKYAEDHWDAFPMLSQETGSTDLYVAIGIFESLFESQLFRLFQWLGLIERRAEDVQGELPPETLEYDIRASALLREWVSFQAVEP